MKRQHLSVLPGKRIVPILILTVVFLPRPIWGEIYSWTDSNGVRHFTNRMAETENAPRGAVVRSDEIAHRPGPDTDPRPRHDPPGTEDGRKGGGHSPEPASRGGQAGLAAKRGGFKVISTGIYEVDGYEVNVTGHQRGRTLQLRGRVSYGPHCARLRISMTLKNRDGDTVSVTSHVDDVGGARSGLIREDKPMRRFQDRVADTWHVVKMRVGCEAE